MKEILIQNAEAVVTCDGQDRVIRNCDIRISGNKIVQIGQGLKNTGSESPVCEVIDARGCFVYPGLVNTHHHFFQTFVRSLPEIDYPNLTVMEWIARIYPIFSRMTADGIYYSSMAAFVDLVKHGCTCAFDHQYCFTPGTGKEAVDRQMKAAKEIGIRYHAGRGANTLSKAEGSSIPDEMVETTEEFLEDCDRLIAKYHDPNPFSMSQIVIAPCQPINCQKETFTESVKMARSRGVRMHTHLGEGEAQGMYERYGRRTLEWCEEIGFAGEDVWYAHCWELTDEEYKRLGKLGSGISHCPAPAVLGGFPILDLPKLKEYGVAVSLGCDGSSTNDSSSMLDTLRMAYLMQAYHSKERGYRCPSPYEMLKIATVSGAQMLGRSDLGTLEEGKAADLFMIEAEKLEFAGAVHDPAALLARTGATGPVKMTMINGETVWKDGHLMQVNEENLFRDAMQCFREISII